MRSEIEYADKAAIPISFWMVSVEQVGTEAGIAKLCRIACSTEK